MSSEKRKIAYIDGKPYEIGEKHTSILKFVKSYLGEKKVPTLCDDPNLAPYGACRVCSVEVALEKDGPTKVVASCHTPVVENQHILPSYILKLSRPQIFFFSKNGLQSKTRKICLMVQRVA